MKKFLAGLLALAMAVSMMTVTAFASETNDGSDSTGTTNAQPTIDTNRKGTITIHKYIKDDNLPWPDSTGDELPSGKVPGGAEGLGGVTFSVFKMAGADDLLRYYSGEETSLDIPTEQELDGTADNPIFIRDADGGYSPNPDNNYYKDKIQPKMINPIYTSTDEANKGVGTSGPLEVGIYLLVETTAPGKVSAKAKPFLVSIPMTVNNEWIYDVHVYPKNEVVYSGPIQIQKTDPDHNPLKGAKFLVEKYDDVKKEWTAVTRIIGESGDWENLTGILVVKGETIKGVLTSGNNGIVEIKGLRPGEYRFVELKPADGYIARENSGWYFTILPDGEHTWKEPSGDYGDYWPVPLETGGFSVEPVKSEVAYGSSYYDLGGVPYVINERPDVEKKVVPRTVPREASNLYDDAAYDIEANYSVGDKIPFKLTIQPPEFSYYNITDYDSFTFKVSDKPTNMVDDINSIKIYGCYVYDYGDEGVSIDQYQYLPDDEYNKLKEKYENEYEMPGDVFSYSQGGIEINNTGDGGFEIELKGILGCEFQKIVITYTATLQDDAEVTSINGNPNVVKLEYSNSPNGGGTSWISDRTVVYSGEIEIHKTSEKNNGLPGVEFELYKQVEVDNLAIEEANPMNKKLTAAEAAEAGLTNSSTTTYVKIGDTYTTGDMGKVRIRGLSDGTYYLVETQTVEGYNLLDGPVTVPLDIGYETQRQETAGWVEIYGKSTDKEGNEITIITGYYSQKNKITGTTKGSSKSITIDGKNYFGVPKDIINRSGFTLPATGGMGTFLFTFVGVAMMAAAVILFITSKKKEAK